MDPEPTLPQEIPPDYDERSIAESADVNFLTDLTVRKEAEAPELILESMESTFTVSQSKKDSLVGDYLNPDMFSARYEDESHLAEGFIEGMDADSLRSFTRDRVSEEDESLNANQSPGGSIKSKFENDIVVDRNLYYELYSLYSEQYQREKMKNNYFQERLSDYYKSKRMYHVFYTDPTTLVQNQKRYERQLEEFDALNEDCAREQSSLTHQVNSLKNKIQYRKTELSQLFDKLQKMELEYSKEIINPADEHGKENAEKFVERFIKQQKIEMRNLTKMRLAYIKIKNKNLETQEAIDALDNLGSNFRLINYEQLKNDNRSLRDKLEEKEMNLTQARKFCKHVMQILAHLREKIGAIQIDTNNYNEQLESVTDELLEVREHSTTLRSERDQYRRSINKLLDELGLLTRPKLLQDMENAVGELQEANAKLVEYKMGVEEVTHKLHKLRRRSSTTLLPKEQSL